MSWWSDEYIAPTRFIPPPNMTSPASLFPFNPQYQRYENVFDNRNLLIYTDGACSNNGARNAAAGWAFVFKPGADGAVGRYYRDLPDNEMGKETSNRAELRAVLDALRHKDWWSEGYTRLTIATDSQYVTDGATYWIHNWIANGWVKSDRRAVKNRDLWRQLLDQVRSLHYAGLDVDIWWIPRQLNTEADRKAKNAAEQAASYRY